MASDASIESKPCFARRKHDVETEIETSDNEQVADGKIVAIDDDPLTLRLLSAHLSKAGHSFQTAATGTAGLDLIDDSTSVAVVDLRLPDLSGFQILQYLQENHQTVQVIVLTVSDDVSDAVEAMRSGAFQFVTKPFDPQEFLV